MYDSYLLIVANSKEGKNQLKDLIKSCKTETNDFDAEVALSFFNYYDLFKEENLKEKFIFYNGYYGECKSIVNSKILVKSTKFCLIRLQSEFSWPSLWIMKISALFPDLTLYLERLYEDYGNLIEKFINNEYLVKDEQDNILDCWGVPWIFRTMLFIKLPDNLPFDECMQIFNAQDLIIQKYKESLDNKLIKNVRKLSYDDGEDWI